MSEMKTIKFPGDTEPREIVDAKARERLDDLEKKVGSGSGTGSGSSQNVELDTTLTQSGKAADAKAVGDALKNVGNPTDEQVSSAVNDYLAENPVEINGLSTTASALLLTILKDCYTGSNQDANILALENELLNNSGGTGGGTGGGEEPEEPDVPDVPTDPDEPETPTLTSISAVLNQDSAAVGTAASELDITVTAHYSDGSTKEVTDYSISGTVAAGENTFTIVYGGKTTTVKVTGANLPIYSLYDTERTDNTQIDTGVNPFGVDQSVAIFFDVTSITPSSNQQVFYSSVSKTNSAATNAYLRSGGRASVNANGVGMGNVFGGGTTTAGDNVKAVFTRQAGSTTFDVYWYQHRATSNADYWTKKTGFEVGAWTLTENNLVISGYGLKFNSFEIYTNRYATEAEALEFTGGTAFTEV